MSHRCRALLLLLLLAALLPGLSRAQSRAPLYFLATGHHLSDDYGMLSFWEAAGGEPILGLPISEPLAEGGRVVQYLQRARLEHDLASGAIALGLLGAERTRWRSFAPAPPRPLSSESLRFAETGHTLSPPFRAFWEGRGGLAIFGFPISEPLWEASGGSFYRVQYFERVRLEHHPVYAGEEREVVVSQLGREAAQAAGVSTEAVPQRLDALAVAGHPDAAPDQAPPTIVSAPAMPTQRPAAVVPVEPDVHPTAPDLLATAVVEPAPGSAATAPPAEPTAIPPPPEPTAVPPTRVPPPAAGGGAKLIEVDISQQWLYAYEGGVLVFSAPVATGKDGFNTPPGEFSVYHKVPMKTMAGTLNGESWEVPDVPSILFIYGSVAIHGTYWHNLFGSGVRISHGCINMRVDDAAWLYEWAPLETAVSVHY